MQETAHGATQVIISSYYLKLLSQVIISSQSLRIPQMSFICRVLQFWYFKCFLFTLAIELRVLVRVFPFQVIHSKAHETENGTRAPRRRRPQLYLFE